MVSTSNGKNSSVDSVKIVRTARFYILGLPHESDFVAAVSTATRTSLADNSPKANENLNNLERRIERLETARFLKSKKYPDNVDIVVDKQVRRARFAVENTHRLYSSRWCWVPRNYYDSSLEDRARILGAPSIHCLCKSLLLENRKYSAGIKADKERMHKQTPGPGNDHTYPQFVMVVLQYTSTLDPDKLTRVIRSLRPNVMSRLEAGHFDWRVAESADNDRITGYTHNSVTPFGMLVDRGSSSKENVRLVLAQAAANASSFLYMGGGHVNLKLGLATSEFVACHFQHCQSVIVGDVTNPRSGGDSEWDKE
jgi:prolyl-tRNA editing enzyme YbaK/EbsC (Cys-tRNA(Pro) deacylase)